MATEVKTRYAYDFGANGATAKVTDNNLNRTQTIEYDLSNRPISSKLSGNGANVCTSQVAYDKCNRIATASRSARRGRRIRRRTSTTQRTG